MSIYTQINKELDKLGFSEYQDGAGDFGERRLWIGNKVIRIKVLDNPEKDTEQFLIDNTWIGSVKKLERVLAKIESLYLYEENKNFNRTAKLLHTLIGNRIMHNNEGASPHRSFYDDAFDALGILIEKLNEKK